MRPGARRSGRRQRSPLFTSHIAFSHDAMSSPNAASTIGLPESREATLHSATQTGPNRAQTRNRAQTSADQEQGADQEQAFARWPQRLLKCSSAVHARHHMCDYHRLGTTCVSVNWLQVRNSEARSAPTDRLGVREHVLDKHLEQAAPLRIARPRPRRLRRLRARDARRNLRGGAQLVGTHMSLKVMPRAPSAWRRRASAHGSAGRSALGSATRRKRRRAHTGHALKSGQQSA
jgi:hypothetical protein